MPQKWNLLIFSLSVRSPGSHLTLAHNSVHREPRHLGTRFSAQGAPSPRHTIQCIGNPLTLVDKMHCMGNPLTLAHNSVHREPPHLGRQSGNPGQMLHSLHWTEAESDWMWPAGVSHLEIQTEARMCDLVVTLGRADGILGEAVWTWKCTINTSN